MEDKKVVFGFMGWEGCIYVLMLAILGEVSEERRSYTGMLIRWDRKR